MTSINNTTRQVGSRAACDDTETTSQCRVSDTVFEDGIVCLIDGKKKRNLRKWLALQYGMTSDEYRRLYNLPKDYPMTLLAKIPTPAAVRVIPFDRPEVIARPRMA